MKSTLIFFTALLLTPLALHAVEPITNSVGLRPPCAGDGQNHHDNLNQQTSPSD